MKTLLKAAGFDRNTTDAITTAAWAAIGLGVVYYGLPQLLASLLTS